MSDSVGGVQLAAHPRKPPRNHRPPVRRDRPRRAGHQPFGSTSRRGGCRRLLRTRRRLPCLPCAGPPARSYPPRAIPAQNLVELPRAGSRCWRRASPGGGVVSGFTRRRVRWRSPAFPPGPFPMKVSRAGKYKGPATVHRHSRVPVWPRLPSGADPRPLCYLPRLSPRNPGAGGVEGFPTPPAGFVTRFACRRSRRIFFRVEKFPAPAGHLSMRRALRARSGTPFLAFRGGYIFGG